MIDRRGGYHLLSGATTEELVRVFGKDGLHWSSLGWRGEEKLLWLAERAIGKSGVVLEIGTHQGVSATVLARAGYWVVTFDIFEFPLRNEIWEHFEVRDRITPIIVKDNQDLHEKAQEISFDLAFVDGNHSYKSVQENMASVVKCGRVIFHDYEPVVHAERTVKFVNSLPMGCTYKMEPYAMWLSFEACGVPEHLRGKCECINA